MKIVNLEKRYKKRVILNQISFVVEQGSCVGILGGNGSGKSTLLSILAGVLQPNAGHVYWGNEDLLCKESLRNELIGYVPQGNPLFEELTAWDNLLLWYDKKTLKKELEQGVLACLGIGEFIKVPVHHMSGGMKKRLSIGCAIANHPKVLLLDEPSSALDLIGKEQIYQYLNEFKAQGGRILLVTHDIHELELCNYWYILKDGNLIPYHYTGNIQNLVHTIQGNRVKL